MHELIAPLLLVQHPHQLMSTQGRSQMGWGGGFKTGKDIRERELAHSSFRLY